MWSTPTLSLICFINEKAHLLILINDLSILSLLAAQTHTSIVSIQSVATGGRELVLQLSSHSSKKPQGTITVKLDMYGSQVRPLSHFIDNT